VVHVTNRAHINVWLGTLKLAFCHFLDSKEHGPCLGLAFAQNCWFALHG
jgi:hypothetical protein